MLGVDQWGWVAKIQHKSMIRGRRKGVSYDLFVPSSEPPDLTSIRHLPLAVVIHGFSREKGQMRNYALRLQQAGVVVLTPNMSSLLGGLSAQQRNIDKVVDHVRWLMSENHELQSKHRIAVDPARIALVGFSAGAAVVFESSFNLLEKSNIVVRALVMLDGVPWPRTIRAAERVVSQADVSARLQSCPLRILSIRAEPSMYNINNKINEVLEALSPVAIRLGVAKGAQSDGPFSIAGEAENSGSPNQAEQNGLPGDGSHQLIEIIDILVKGARHADCENPTTWLMRAFGVFGSMQAQDTILHLTCLFLLDCLLLQQPEKAENYSLQHTSEIKRSDRYDDSTMVINSRGPLQGFMTQLEELRSSGRVE